MSLDPDDPSLLAIAAAVSDGAAVDWDRARVTDADTQRLLADLRRIATVAAAHRTTGVDAAGGDPAAAEPWRHLLLLDRIGAGAFGAVYRGWDPQLDRAVAVKLFAPTGPDVSSPLTEARHLARVRHPNIVTVYGAEQDAERPGLWMELIEGQTLDEIVRAIGAFGARETIGIGIDLCHALSALHGAGLLHRDIKPQNVMREVGGRIVLMDFSGARGVIDDDGDAAITGTPLFMAPELFTGGVASPASDLYSLGALLFVLLTGQPPVAAGSVADLRAAHRAGTRKRLRDLRPDLPLGIVQVVERALDPDLSRRYQTASELEGALAAAGATPMTAPGDEPAQSRLRRRVEGALVVAVLAIAAAVVWMQPSPPPATPVRFSIEQAFTGGWPRISKDGRSIAFGTLADGLNRFWVRPLDSEEGHTLSRTTARETPFWSPDGRVLAFFADNNLSTIDVASGEVRVIAESPSPHGGDWSGQWLIFARDTGIYRVAPDGTQLSPVTQLDSAHGDHQHTWPEFLPDGNRFIYMIRSSKAERTGVYLGRMDGGPHIRLMDAYSRTTYADGHLLFVRGGTLLAQPFDVARGVLEGDPIPIEKNIKYHPTGDGAFDVSRTGVLIYSHDSGGTTSRLVIYDRHGRELRQLTAVDAQGHPRFSPDGQRIAAERIADSGGNADLWVYDAAGNGEVRLTRTDARSVKPAWSPDGKRIAFSSRRTEAYEIFIKAVDDAKPEQPLETIQGDKYVEDWSHDGRYLSAALERKGLFIIPLDGSAKPWMVRRGPGQDTWQSAFSPDMKWLAYMSEESGRPEVYIEPFPGTGERFQVSARGGADPHWRADGRELFYLASDGTVVAVDTSHPDWRHPSATPLFHVTVPYIAGAPDISVSPDGLRFVVNVFVSDPIPTPVQVVVNWTALLKQHQ